MENFILGLLMIQKLTAYELHVTTKNHYQGICSSSLGNIQRALKKLHEKGLVTQTVVKEGKITKKIFAITPEGRAAFMAWLNAPILINRENNMEIGRLLLLGFLTKEEQLKNIDLTIESIKADYEYLKNVESVVAAMEPKREKLLASEEEARSILGIEQQGMEELLKAVGNEDFLEVANDVAKFNYLTLKFGLDQTKFQLDWFMALRKQLEAK